MIRRMLLVLAVIALFLGGLGFVKFRQVKSGMAAQASFQPPPESVTTTIAHEETWPATLNAIGSVVAIKGVTVSADLPGIVQKISFESGATVSAGAILVQLDTQQEQAQLADAEAQRELANANYARMGELVKQGVISRQEYDRATAEQRAGDAKVAEIRATIARKTIRAPFSGSLGIRQVNLGQYLSAGSPVVPLQALDPIYVNFSLPQQVVSRLKAGQTVHASPDDGTRTDFAGRVTAIDSVVDPATRNVQVQATFPNREHRLHPGMFVQTALSLGSSESVITLPASAISYAPYGDSVFVVADLKGPKGETYRGVRQQFVKLGPARGDQVAVTSGLKSGDEVVTSGAFKLRNGAAVSPNNKVQPSDSATPTVEDR